jgi:hypothetical protein
MASSGGWPTDQRITPDPGPGRDLCQRARTVSLPSANLA